jgi:hypothetical protein
MIETFLKLHKPILLGIPMKIILTVPPLAKGGWGDLFGYVKSPSLPLF